MTKANINRALITVVAKNWPLATERQAKRQAVRLLKAHRYLKLKGIAACEVGSKFEYSQGPKVLKC